MKSHNRLSLITLRAILRCDRLVYTQVDEEREAVEFAEDLPYVSIENAFPNTRPSVPYLLDLERKFGALRRRYRFQDGDSQNRLRRERARGDFESESYHIAGPVDVERLIRRILLL